MISRIATTSFVVFLLPRFGLPTPLSRLQRLFGRTYTHEILHKTTFAQLPETPICCISAADVVSSTDRVVVSRADAEMGVKRYINHTVYIIPTEPLEGLTQSLTGHSFHWEPSFETGARVTRPWSQGAIVRTI